MPAMRGCVVEMLEPRRLLAASVLTYHNDIGRTGLNDQETILTPSNVNSGSFGKLFSVAVDGHIYAQPLYMPGVRIPGKGLHNVVFVATQHDSVYAFDGGTSALLWHDRFVRAGAGITAVPYADVTSEDITPEIGITGTPVVDPASGTLYVVAKTKEVRSDGNHYVFKLHALDVGTGQEQLGGPALIADTLWAGGDTYTYVAGPTIDATGAGSAGGKLTFNALRELQRSALLLLNGVVYVAWASHGDNPPYHGWLIGYDANTLQQTAVFNATPDGAQGGIWMSGGGPSADAQGNIYVATGNGDYTASSGGQSYGNSFLKLSTAGDGLTVADSFTPHNWSDLSTSDMDLGSGGVLLLPDQPGASPHLMISGGKEGILYLINRDQLGGFHSGGDRVIQKVTGQTQGLYDTPAFFGGNVYLNAPGGALEAFSLTNGQLSSTPVSAASQTLGFPGATPSISSNGAGSAIVWTLQCQGTDKAGVLRAYDATNLAKLLYSSDQAGSRDQYGPGTKFAVPTVANGKVYVGSANSLTIFGLLGGPQPVPPPTVSVPAAPSDTAANAPSATVVRLTWTDHATNESGFKIERSTDGQTFTQIAVINQSNVTSYADRGLTAATQYYYRVRATNSAGDSSYSAVASATTHDSAPAAPTDLAAAVTSPTAIQLTWTNRATGQTGVKIERSTDGVSFAQVAQIDGASSTYTDRGLSAATQYYYRIRVTSGAGDSPYSSVASAQTQRARLAAPSDLSARAASATAIVLSWADNATNETGYRIERSTDGSHFAQVAQGDQAGATTYTDTGLAAGTHYYYRVCATNADGSSPYSAPVSATTLLQPNGRHRRRHRHHDKPKRHKLPKPHGHSKGQGGGNAAVAAGQGGVHGI